jgi:hypothetical protein
VGHGTDCCPCCPDYLCGSYDPYSAITPLSLLPHLVTYHLSHPSNLHTHHTLTTRAHAHLLFHILHIIPTPHLTPYT